MTTQKLLVKYLSFGVVGVLILLLASATVLEKIYGSSFAIQHIYHSSLFIYLWGVAATTAFICLLQNKVYKQRSTFCLHLSFILILAGALTTHLCGTQGNIHLRQDAAPTDKFVCNDGSTGTFPFQISLKEFNLSYYPGTFAPMDFISTILVTTPDGTRQEAQISMNHIFSFHNYRFYQSKYDKDGLGSTLSVSHDPYGIAVTYTGYTFLLLSLFAFFFQKGSRFHSLLHHPLMRRTAILCFLLLYPAMQLSAARTEHPKSLPREVAEKFGDLYIYYNHRICPLQTLARDFTTKLYGKPEYKGLTSEQVLTGWFFYYDNWKNEPMIRVKSKEIQQLLKTDGPYARLTDFLGTEGYRLKAALQGNVEIKDRAEAETANEKFSLVSMVSTGNLLKIYPYRTEDGKQPEWYSLVDKLPADMPEDQWLFITSSMNYIAEKITLKKYDEVISLLDKIRKYQRKELTDSAPSESRFKAEKIYNRLGYNKPIALFCITAGLAAFIFFCRKTALRQVPGRLPMLIFNIPAVVIFVYLCILLALRGYVSNHLPLSNGFETMQFMAWCALLLTFLLQRKFVMALPFGFLLCGLTLMVSMLGESNPQITQLMPVLQSPLLSVHVVVIMIAYALLAFVMLNGVTAITLHKMRKDCEEQIRRLQIVSQIILYPAIFLLAVGIFIGAVWANVSWGRYWGWDPKEVWALITMLVYASALHTDSLPWFRRPMFFHIFGIVAFITVLVTYFGVNFLLGGIHSYANG